MTIEQYAQALADLSSPAWSRLCNLQATADEGILHLTFACNCVETKVDVGNPILMTGE